MPSGKFYERAHKAFAVSGHLLYTGGMQTLQTPPKKYSEALTTDKAASIAAWLTEHKAADLVCLDLAGKCAFTDCLLVVTASSVRHAQSLADGINALCTEHNFEYLRMEGYQTGQWILVDLNDIVINIFQPSVRDMYKLESLWQMPQRPSPEHSTAAKSE